MTTYPSADGALTVGSPLWQIRLILDLLNMGGGGWLQHAEHALILTEHLGNAMSAFTPNRRLARLVAFGGG